MDYAHIRSRFRPVHIKKLYQELLLEKEEKYSNHPDKLWYTMPYGLTMDDYMSHFFILTETRDSGVVIFHVHRLDPLSDRNPEQKYRVLPEAIRWIPESNSITAPGFGLHEATTQMLDRMIKSVLSDGLKNWCYSDICLY